MEESAIDQPDEMVFCYHSPHQRQFFEASSVLSETLISTVEQTWIHRCAPYLHQTLPKPRNI